MEDHYSTEVEIANQPHNLPIHATSETCSGRTFIVIGANTGLGLEAARSLVAAGSAKVIMGVRNISAGETAKADIENTTGKTGIASVWLIDLSSYDSVKAFAKKALTELDRIDALIENAAVAVAQRVLAEGHLVPVTVNVFSTFLLAVLLLPRMSADAKRFGILPHISIISSGASFDFEKAWNTIKSDPITKMEDESSPVMATYPLTKLLEILAVRYLAPVLPVSRTGVVINTVNPGLCKTELGRNAPPEFRQQLAEKHARYGRTAEDGSRTLLHGALAGKDSHGSYLSSCTIAE
ncbi:putative short chain dehydrogenase/ reductase [Talaromyces proteolyticus]|uniref:Short chain dehydrogenase/ reductase n=1 Tax=Talaromyces proteolyticus TaxID=1131652 RepID=A0AAD4KDS1_9EURO|nr:putative short chain dehydrogenase/ reductase [Talaromyces proteolyticus]KAH8689181.1 putative short chain dehydrogenase/ reductase [Talaromyces proteolyticus]